MVEGTILGFGIATVFFLILLGLYLLTLTRPSKGMRHTRKDEDDKKEEHGEEGHDKSPHADGDPHHTKKDGFLSQLLRRLAFWGVIALAVCAGAMLLYFLTPMHEWVSFRPPTVQSAVSAYGTKECPGQKQDYILDQQHWNIEVNPGNICRVLFNERIGHVVQDPTLVYLVSVNDMPAAGHYSLCPKSLGEGRLNWDCSPRE